MAEREVPHTQTNGVESRNTNITKTLCSGCDAMEVWQKVSAKASRRPRKMALLKLEKGVVRFLSCAFSDCRSLQSVVLCGWFFTRNCEMGWVNTESLWIPFAEIRRTRGAPSLHAIPPRHSVYLRVGGHHRRNGNDRRCNLRDLCLSQFVRTGQLTRLEF